VGALPVLLWGSQGSAIDLQVRPDVLKLSASALLAGVYYIFLCYPHVWINTLHGIATLMFFLIARRLNLSAHDSTFTNFVIAIGIVLGIQVITTYWLPVTFILQLQILRIGLFLMIIGYLYFAGYLAERIKQGTINGFAGGLVIFGFVTYFSPLLPLLLLVLYTWLTKARWRQWSTAVLLVLLQVATVYAGFTSGFWSPGIHIYEPRTAWTETQDWARENTPRDAMFITPPHIFLHYIPDWRTFSERGTLATLVEIFEFPHPAYIPYWQERFEAIAPGAISKFNGNYFDTFKTTRDAYYSLTPEDYLRVAQKYNIRYLVVEKPYLQPFTVIYQNEGFVIYDLQN
jgi:general stress protein CsbA